MIERTMLLAATAVVLAGGAMAKDCVLAENGRSGCKVVVPANVSPTVAYAARELVLFLKEQTGAEVGCATNSTDGVGVWLEETSKGKDDSFRVMVDARGVHVSGNARGVLYGVYEILRRFGGCEWYAPNVQTIPKLDRFAVPEGTDFSCRPAFLVRETSWWELRNNPSFALRRRMNGQGVLRMQSVVPPACTISRNLSLCHTFAKLCPSATYGKDHPEYYALHNGHRCNTGDIQLDQQLCLTNPDVLRIVTSNVLAEIRANPGFEIYGVSQNDNRKNCQCANCAAIDKEEGSSAGTVLRFVNAVAEAVEREFPDKLVETLAYEYSRKPPRKVRPRDNVMICLCSIECDFRYPIVGNRNPENLSFIDDIRGWRDMAKHLYVWDYTTAFNNYPTSFPNVYAIAGNLKFYRDSGVTHMFEQGCGHGPYADFAALKSYLISELEWNPDLPLEPLLEKFFAAYYGKAAPVVRRIFDETYAVPRDERTHPLKWNAEIVLPGTDASFYEHLAALWKEAESLVTDDPTCRENVRWGAFGNDYTRALLFARSQSGVLMARDPRRYDRLKAIEMKTVAKDVLRHTDARRLKDATRIGEHWEKHDAVRKELQDFVDSEVPSSHSDIVRFEETRFSPVKPARGGIVDDSGASGGKALFRKGESFGWGEMKLDGIIFDVGVEYRARIRLRVEREPTEKGDGEALWAGIYDYRERKPSIDTKTLKLSQAREDGYFWFDLPPWLPQPGDRVWFAPGRYDINGGAKPKVKGVYFDCIEIRRADLNILANAKFAPDGFGAALSWHYRNHVEDSTVPMPGAGPSGRDAIRLKIGKGQFFEQMGIKLADGGRYRFGAWVRTKGIPTKTVRLSEWWGSAFVNASSQDWLPPDTAGKWIRIAWEGEIKKGAGDRTHLFGVFSMSKYGNEEAYVDLCEPYLEPCDAATAEKSAPIAAVKTVPPPIVPIDPLLDDIDANVARMTFYYPGELAESPEKYALLASIDGTNNPCSANLGTDRRAALSFGTIAEGEHVLSATLAKRGSKEAVAHGEWKIRAKSRMPAAKGRRLNNFAVRVGEFPLSDGEYAFDAPKDGQVFLAFDREIPGAKVFLDGEKEPAVTFRDGEPQSAIRTLRRGRHVARITGSDGRGGCLLVNAIAFTFHRSQKTFSTDGMDISKNTYGFEMYRRFFLPSFGMLGFYRWRKEVDGFAEPNGLLLSRGILPAGVLATPRIGAYMDDPAAMFGWVASVPSYRDGLPLFFDEVGIWGPREYHFNTAEAVRRMREHGLPPFSIMVNDARTSVYDDPRAQTPLVSAVVNTGGYIMPEVYISAYADDEAMRMQFEHYARFCEALKAMVPSAMSRTMFYFGGYLSAWSDFNAYSSPEVDMKVLFDDFVHMLATDPRYEGIGGIGATGFPAGDEELVRWISRVIRHYAVEGHVDRLSERYGLGYHSNPLRNCDFNEGLDGWVVSAAEPGSVAAMEIPGYGRTHQWRQYPAWLPKPKGGNGDRVARLTASAHAQNVLSQTVRGLEKGRPYMLTFITASHGDNTGNLEAITNFTFGVSFDGAKEEKEFAYRRFSSRAIRGSRSSEVKGVCTHRHVFTPEKDEVTVSLSDWPPSGGGTRVLPGHGRIVNYVNIRPYYVASAAEFEILRRIHRDAHR